MSNYVMPGSLRAQIDQLDRGIEDLQTRRATLVATIGTIDVELAGYTARRAAIMDVVEAFQPLLGFPPINGGGAAAASNGDEAEERSRRNIRDMVLTAIQEAGPGGISRKDLQTKCETIKRVVETHIMHWVGEGRVTYDTGTEIARAGAPPAVVNVTRALPEPAPEPAPEPEPEPEPEQEEVPPPGVQPPTSEEVTEHYIDEEERETQRQAVVVDKPFVFHDMSGEVRGFDTIHDAVHAMSGMLDTAVMEGALAHQSLLDCRQSNLTFLELLIGASAEIGTDISVKFSRAIEKTKPDPLLHQPDRAVAAPAPAPAPVVEERVDEPDITEPQTDQDLLIELLQDNPDGLGMREIGLHGVSATVVYNAERAGAVKQTAGLYTLSG
jgi:hypothetical protein